MKQILLFCLALVLAVKASGQNDTTSTDTLRHVYFFPLNDNADTTFVDTSLHLGADLGYGLPFDRNLFFADFTNVGNTGLPLTPRNDFSSFQTLNLNNRYTRSRDEMPFYDVPSAYTELAFRLNYTEGQYTQFKHTQNFIPDGNFSIDYQRSNSQGQYANQATLWNQMHANFRYEKNRLSTLLWLDWNGIDAGQNGGIANRELFLLNGETDRAVFPIHLESASSKFEFRDFGTRIGLQLDSTQSLNAELSRVVNRYVYTDELPTNGYYPTIYKDSSSTSDTLASEIYEFNGFWEFKTSKGIAVSLGSRIQHYSYFDGTDSRTETPLSIYGSFNALIGGTTLSIQPELWLTSLYASDFEINGEVKQNKAFLSARIYRRSPSLNWFSNQTNHVNWNLTPNKVVGLDVKATYSFSKNISLNASYQLTQGYIYLDSTITAIQAQSPLNYGRLSLKYGVDFWVFHFRTELIGQVADQSFVRIPSFISLSDLYYEGNWFENALLIRLGGRLNYTDSYRGNEFAPMLAMSYLQRDNSIQVGNYPFADVYVSAKIRTFKAYVMLQHATKGFFGFNYFATPYQPLPERAVRIGLSWNFFN